VYTFSFGQDFEEGDDDNDDDDDERIDQNSCTD